MTGQLKTGPQRSKNGEAKLVRSPHIWQNKFVSYMPSFSGYFFSHKDYGHRANECRKVSRNRNVVYQRCNTYGHSMSNCRNIHRSAPMHDRKSPFATLRNVNYECYNYNGFGHRSHECRKNRF